MILECPACNARFSVPDRAIPPEGRSVRCGKCTHEWHVNPAAVAIEEAFPVTPPEPVEIPTDASDDFLNQIDSAVAQVASEAATPEVTEPAEEYTPATVPDDEFLRKIDSAIAAASTPPMAKKAAALKKKLSPKPFKLAASAFALLWALVALVAYFPSGSQSSLLSGVYRAMGASATEGLLFADIKMERVEADKKTRFIIFGKIRNDAKVFRKVPTVRVRLLNKAGEVLWGREYPVDVALKSGATYPFRIANIETSFAKSVTAIQVDMGNSLQLMVR